MHFICPNIWEIIVREYIFDHFILISLYLVCHFCKWVLYHLLANNEQTSQNYSITVKEEKINTTLTNLTLWKKIPIKQLKLNCELTSQWSEKNIFWIPFHHNINIYILFTPLHTFHWYWQGEFFNNQSFWLQPYIFCEKETEHLTHTLFILPVWFQPLVWYTGSHLHMHRPTMNLMGQGLLFWWLWQGSVEI